MDRFRHRRLLLLSVALCALLAAPSAAARGPVSAGDAAFVAASCQHTRYPAACERSLARYAAAVRRSPRRLAHVSLVVALTGARSASASVSRLAAAAPRQGAAQDCAETMGDAVEQLWRSLREIKRMGRAGSPRFGWCLSNIQTWVSASLTYQTTCLDGLSESPGVDPRLQAAIRRRVEHLSRLTSNTLAFVNRLGPGN